MNIKIIIITLFLSIQAHQQQEMTDCEKGIVAFMERPEDYMSCDRANRNEVRQKYFLLLPRWGS